MVVLIIMFASVAAALCCAFLFWRQSSRRVGTPPQRATYEVLHTASQAVSVLRDGLTPEAAVKAAPTLRHLLGTPTVAIADQASLLACHGSDQHAEALARHLRGVVTSGRSQWLSAANAHWMTAATGDAWLGYALAYGGVIQLLAGMWEFKNRNVFGATAFSTYGGFWIGLFLWVQFVAPHATSASAADHDLGWILLAFAIFNTYMLLWSSMVNTAIFMVFLTLEATEILLFIGNFAANANIVKIGGYVGILTALSAWYASAAGVGNGVAGRVVLPVGQPFWNPAAAAAAEPAARA